MASTSEVARCSRSPVCILSSARKVSHWMWSKSATRRRRATPSAAFAARRPLLKEKPACTRDSSRKTAASSSRSPNATGGAPLTPMLASRLSANHARSSQMVVCARVDSIRLRMAPGVEPAVAIQQQKDGAHAAGGQRPAPIGFGDGYRHGPSSIQRRPGRRPVRAASYAHAPCPAQAWFALDCASDCERTDWIRWRSHWPRTAPRLALSAG